MGAASPLLPGEAHYTGLSGQYIVVRHSRPHTQVVAKCLIRAMRERALFVNT